LSQHPLRSTCRDLPLSRLEFIFPARRHCVDHFRNYARAACETSSRRLELQISRELLVRSERNEVVVLRSSGYSSTCAPISLTIYTVTVEGRVLHIAPVSGATGERGCSRTVESLQAWYTDRETFSATCLCGSPLQDEKQLTRLNPEEFGFVRPEQRQPFTL